MDKQFLPYDVVRNNALKLAYRINQDGFTPDVIYVSLRGGAYLGNVISEYFKILRRQKEGRPVYYAAVVARSYTGIGEADDIKVEGWTYDPKYLRIGDRVLLVDDIFDTGRTINYLTRIILETGIPRKDIKVAVHDYKHFPDKPSQLPVQPDYWCRKFDLPSSGEDMWIHYLSHELVGLSSEELEKYYYADDPELKDILGSIKQRPL
ncbi:MAG: phosphoribosyltransferase [Treponema sp.]|jgi:hypoxanthine phosphoribosyltransferase|nr:phosphoribosyltransferase [Treponema sp.]